MEDHLLESASKLALFHTEIHCKLTQERNVSGNPAGGTKEDIKEKAGLPK
jgi:hypothetical protein